MADGLRDNHRHASRCQSFVPDTRSEYFSPLYAQTGTRTRLGINSGPGGGCAARPASYPLNELSVLEQVRADAVSAMKSGDKDRVGALRLLISELQKDTKEGARDELAVLRRERKRRLDAAEQFEQGGRPELAAAETAEAALIAGYLPSDLGDDELDGLVAEAITQTGAASPKDMGAVMKVVMARAGGRVDGKRASAAVRAALGTKALAD
jgi:uncharacterized protein